MWLTLLFVTLSNCVLILKGEKHTIQNERTCLQSQSWDPGGALGRLPFLQVQIDDLTCGLFVCLFYNMLMRSLSCKKTKLCQQYQ